MHIFLLFCHAQIAFLSLVYGHSSPLFCMHTSAFFLLFMHTFLFILWLMDTLQFSFLLFFWFKHCAYPAVFCSCTHFCSFFDSWTLFSSPFYCSSFGSCSVRILVSLVHAHISVHSLTHGHSSVLLFTVLLVQTLCVSCCLLFMYTFLVILWLMDTLQFAFLLFFFWFMQCAYPAVFCPWYISIVLSGVHAQFCSFLCLSMHICFQEVSLVLLPKSEKICNIHICVMDLRKTSPLFIEHKTTTVRAILRMKPWYQIVP